MTEPSGGSDVSTIKCRAIIDKNDPNYYIVNGEKYLITNVLKADYITTGVRILDEDNKNNNNNNTNLSLLLIERNTPGIHIEPLKTQGLWMSNLCYIVFNNVRVPINHIIGEKHKAWPLIMSNFNNERLMIAIQSNRLSRICMIEAVRFAKQRRTFNQRLIDHQIIRHKIVEMIRKIESTHHLLERTCYLMENEKIIKNNKEVASLIALCKVQSTKTFEFVCREACQIIGGRSYIIGGSMNIVERCYREIRASVIGGGSEEILMDFAVRNISKL